MSAFLFKTEPGSYSFDDLVREKRTVWEGISNAQALIYLRQVRRGDDVAVYHTGAEKSVVGLARAASDPYPDPRLGDAKRVVVDLVPVRKLAAPVPLATFRTDTALKNVALVKNTRLSTMPLTAAELARIAKL
ncbi:MAG: EVE domain-containing protein, partial [Candidatus Eisenbacteria bacterium]